MGRYPQLTPEVTTALSAVELIDYHLEHNPDYPFAVYPSSDPNAEPDEIPFLEYGRATHRVARLLCAGGEVPVRKGEVVGVVANTDSILYMAVVGGIMRAGLTAFPISPRNSAPAICDMLKKTSAHRLLFTRDSLWSLLEAVRDELAGSGYEISLEELPAFEKVFPKLAHETAADPFEPVAMPARGVFVNDTLVILHSSGSTGFPKPIPWTVKFIQAFTWADFVEIQHQVGLDISLATPGLPPFHAMAFFFHFIQPLLAARPGAMFRPMYPRSPEVPNPATTLAALKAVRATCALVVPTLLEAWMHEPSSVEYLKTLTSIGFAGGPLAAEVGDALTRAGCRIRPGYGATEFGAVTRQLPDPRVPAPPREEWRWLEFTPHFQPRWIPQEGGTAMELEVLGHDRQSLAVENLADVRGYATKDLFIPHPSKPGLWRIIGRTDDLIVLANGEKVVPGPTEGTLLAHPVIQGAVMFGRERNQVGILVEPAEAHLFDHTNGEALAAFRNAIWPAVEEANRSQPAYARIFKEMILVASPGKPLPRVGKGTVSGKAALVMYQAEINALYDAVENQEQGSGVPPPQEWTEPDIFRWLLALVTALRGGEKVNPSGDLFAQGFDSLSATFLRNHVLAALRSSRDTKALAAVSHVENSFVYAHPSVERMSSALGALLGTLTNERADRGSAVDKVHALIRRYTEDMPTMNGARTQDRFDERVVLLTGTTGGLGSHLLATLLVDEKVTKVYALNRPSKASSLERQDASFRDRDLDLTLLTSPKLVFIEGDAATEKLGLSTELYNDLRSSVTTIIHNAWRLDFNLGLSSFEPNIRATRRLLDLGLTSAHASETRVLFTSSIGVTRAWPSEFGPYPEAPVDDARWCIGGGYGEAKYVSERLLVAAAERGLQTTSFRIGQIAGGDANGAWASTDWVPIMLKSGVALGCLPDAAGTASWMPADAVADGIVEVALGEAKPELALNLRHPRPIGWHTLMSACAQALQDAAVTSTLLPLVDVQTWVDKVAAASSVADENTLRRIPAIKLLDFFSGLSSADATLRASGKYSKDAETGGLTMLSIEKAEAASNAFRDMHMLDEKDATRWVTYWKARGVFEDVAGDEL